MKNNSQKYIMTLFYADKKKNGLMKAFGLCHDGKQFIEAHHMSFCTTEKVNKDYIFKIIEKSKECSDGWVPAIEYLGEIYCDQAITELSDGRTTFFIGENCL